MPPTTRSMTRNTQNNSTKNFSDQDSFQRTLDDNQLEATCTQITEKIGDQDRRVVIRAKWIRPQNPADSIIYCATKPTVRILFAFFIIRNTFILRKYTYYSHNFWFLDFLSILYPIEVSQAHDMRWLNAGGTVNYMQKNESCTSKVKRGMKFFTECVNGKLKVNGGSRFRLILADIRLFCESVVMQ